MSKSEPFYLRGKLTLELESELGESAKSSIPTLRRKRLQPGFVWGHTIIKRQREDLDLLGHGWCWPDQADSQMNKNPAVFQGLPLRVCVCTCVCVCICGEKACRSQSKHTEKWNVVTETAHSLNVPVCSRPPSSGPLCCTTISELKFQATNDLPRKWVKRETFLSGN